MTIIRPIFSYYDNRHHNRQEISPLLLVFILILTAFAGTAPPVWGQEEGDGIWERAIEAIQNQQNADAIPLLQMAIQQDPAVAGEGTRLLAYAVEAEGDAGEAERILREGVSNEMLSASDRSSIAIDLGALLRRQERLSEADEVYTTALGQDSTRATAYLNRANIRVETQLYQEAIEDYRFYLVLRPATTQRPQVEQMIILLTQQVEAQRIEAEEAARREAELAEARRIAEEEERRRAEAEAEQRRVAEEQARQEAAARREQMLSSVLQSLGNTESEAQSFELESEEIREYEEEIDILD